MSLGVRTADWALPALVCALGLVELASLTGLDGRGAAAVVLVASCAWLVLRRTRPLVCATAAALLHAGLPFVGPAYDEAATGLLVVLLAVYALGRWVAGLRGVIGVVVVWLVVLGGYTLVDLRDKGLDDAVFVLAFTAPPYVMGRVVRRLADYNDLLAREQELVRREAVRDERDRIARDLHDVIAHSLSAMVVQVAAAEELLRRDPDRAEAVLGRVAETGRRAIAEAGGLLHVLRDSDGELGLAPTPSLRDLPELRDEFERDGLAVDLVVDGPLEQLPPAVDTSAYRIARETLTNALRYAPDRRVRLEVSVTAEGLTIRSVNAAAPAPGGGLGAGLGLAGLRERVDLLGGSLRHGVTGEGTFELVAALPREREPV